MASMSPVRHTHTHTHTRSLARSYPPRFPVLLTLSATKANPFNGESLSKKGVRKQLETRYCLRCLSASVPFAVCAAVSVCSCVIARCVFVRVHSLAAMKKNSVEIFYLHAPDPNVPIEETLAEVQNMPLCLCLSVSRSLAVSVCLCLLGAGDV